MRYSCAPILVGVVSLVSEILLLSKMAKFPFPTMDYSPRSSKNLIDWNWLKKFMQVRIVKIFMCTNFGGHGFSSFGDIANYKNSQISLLNHGVHPMHTVVVLVLLYLIIVLLPHFIVIISLSYSGHGISGTGLLHSFSLLALISMFSGAIATAVLMKTLSL